MESKRYIFIFKPIFRKQNSYNQWKVTHPLISVLFWIFTGFVIVSWPCKLYCSSELRYISNNICGYIFVKRSIFFLLLILIVNLFSCTSHSHYYKYILSLFYSYIWSICNCHYLLKCLLLEYIIFHITTLTHLQWGKQIY